MDYNEYKELEKEVFGSENIDAKLYFLQNIKFINKIESFKYTFSDLNKQELNHLYLLNNLEKDDIILGNEIHRVIFDEENKRKVLKKVSNIDIYNCLKQIQMIKNK